MKKLHVTRLLLGMAVVALQPTEALAQSDSMPADLPNVHYHLTARPWSALNIAKTAYLDRLEGECRFWIKHQAASGAIIDPFTNTETEYSTSYFAHALGTLLSAGRATDLATNGQKAMDHATSVFASGGAAEFWIAPLTEAIDFYAQHVPAATLDTWKVRMKTAFSPGGNTNNWRTYFMKGQWLRAKASFISKTTAVADVENNWNGTQKGDIAPTKWSLYHDHTSDPDTLAVETVGRGNLLALAATGYDGPSATAIRTATETGTRTSLLLMDPSGQMPANGRTDNHVWGDVGYQLAFETMAEQALAQGDKWLAGQYRHAALLTFQNIDRWKRSDGAWAGSFYVTKNHLDPAKRVGYQPASQYGTYNGSLMFHTSEAFQTRRSDIAENPSPVEIGGYALATDSSFAAAFANAGGMAMEIDLRGATSLEFSNYWTALGIVRFGRPGWDTRLGPSDGQRDIGSGLGVTFAPTFQEGGSWIRLASVPNRYEGAFTVTFAHPLLVRVSVDYAPKGGGGPKFHDELVVTPDGLLSTVTASGQSGAWGMTLPLLEDDGAPLVTSAVSADRIARTSYQSGKDEQTFIELGKNVVFAADTSVLSSYGQLRPVRATTDDAAHRTFVYPRNANDPSAEAVRDSFQNTPTGFQSVLGRVDDTLYVGRTSAGGVGTSIDVTGDGQPDATFSASCGFILQIRGGVIASVESDRAVTATIGGKSVSLTAYTPVVLDATALASDAGAASIPGIPEIGMEGGVVAPDGGGSFVTPAGNSTTDAATSTAEPALGASPDAAAGCACRNARGGTGSRCRGAFWLAIAGTLLACTRRRPSLRHGLVMALAWSAGCDATIGPTNSQPGAADRALAGSAHNAIGASDEHFACDESVAPIPSTLRRLTMTQYENTLASLAAWSLGSQSAADSVMQAVAAAVAVLPEDRREPVTQDPHGSYRRLDQSLQQEHVDGFYAVGTAMAAALTAQDRIGKVVGKCALDGDPNNDAACLDSFIERFGTRVLRRPLTQEDGTFYRSVYGSSTVADPLAYADVITVMLNAPEFVYLVEHGDTSVAGQPNVFRLSPFEMAARLSYQFWQTMPDDALWADAETGKLTMNDTYRAQVERMFNDPRRQGTIQEFVADWLKVEDLPALDAHDNDVTFRAFAGADLPNADLRQHMIDDALGMVDYLVWSKRGTMSDLLTSELSFNRSPDLAKIYGVSPWDGGPNPPSFPGGQRPGFLTRALFLSSGSANTRPVLKGVFIRRRILCDDLPPPPPGVNASPPDLRPDMTTREVIEEITEKTGTVCVSCHKTAINPLGFATESFDALGRYRTSQRLFGAAGNDAGSKPIDTRSIPLVDDGDTTASQGPSDLVGLIVKSGKAGSCLARNYFRFTYARWEDTNADACALEDLRKSLENGGAISDMLREVALSPGFSRRSFQ